MYTSFCSSIKGINCKSTVGTDSNNWVDFSNKQGGKFSLISERVKSDELDSNKEAHNKTNGETALRKTIGGRPKNSKETTKLDR